MDRDGAGNNPLRGKLAEYLDVPHVVTVNSCTSGLFLSLIVNGGKVGDEVICPSLPWCSIANVAHCLGVKPVFCDVDPDTLCVTPETMLAKLTPRTKAVIVVYLGGLTVDVVELRRALPAHVAIVGNAARAIAVRS